MLPKRRYFLTTRARVTLAVVACIGVFFTPAVLTQAESDNPLAALEAYKTCDPIYDPLEKWNRAMFTLNEGLDGWFINPVITSTFFFLPPLARAGVANVFWNLNEPATFFNCLFQKRFTEAGNTFARFVVNTIFGVLGLFDVASKIGIPYTSTNFNRTLRTWGATAGPYIVWPILGPLTLRDTVGVTVDFFLDPYNIVCLAKGWSEARHIKTYLALANEKEMILPHYEALKKESTDPYSSVRSVYYQARHCDREKDMDEGNSVW